MARDSVNEAPKTVKNVSKQLEALVQSLTLVKEEERLQTTSIEQQVNVIIDIAEELKIYYDQLRAEQKKNFILLFLHAFSSGDKRSKQLGEILIRLDRARDDLMLRISVTLVGLIGNLKDGFYVAFDVLIETNSKVKEVLGRNLTLVDRLKGRSLQQNGNLTSKADSS